MNTYSSNSVISRLPTYGEKLDDKSSLFKCLFSLSDLHISGRSHCKRTRPLKSSEKKKKETWMITGLLLLHAYFVSLVYNPLF